MEKKEQDVTADVLDIENNIFIKGARSNNLKNIDLTIPKNQLVVVTGVSGSGKSSLTMDTLFAEGQRRYVESLSSYARQFLMRMKKPELDYIKGICPAIAIEQKVSTSNARSTVGTLTEVYDYLRLLFARVGHTISPISGKEVKKHEVADVVDYINGFEEGAKFKLWAELPAKYGERSLSKELELLLQKGYTRVRFQGDLIRIEDLPERKDQWLEKSISEFSREDLLILVDRFVLRAADDDNQKRIADSIQTAFYESEGSCIIEDASGAFKDFNNRYELDGMIFPELTPQLFNYNNPLGACPSCEGFGKTMGISKAKVIPNQSLSVFEGAIACWKGEKYGRWLQRFLEVAHHFDFPIHQAYQDLSKENQKLLWKGNKHFKGINRFFDELEEKLYKIQNRVMLARYRGRTDCATCDGSRLRPETAYVKVSNHSISDLTHLPIDELLDFFKTLELSDYDRKIAGRLLIEINTRLEFMSELGLTYLTLDRLSSTLSGGETQRINLTRTLGSNLTSSMYILDEPSVGLHPRDTARLVKVLKELRDLGNTVIVVEHEEDVIRNADFLIDVGPKAGINGGHIVFAGDFDTIKKEAKDSLTVQYLTGVKEVPVPKERRRLKNYLSIKGAAQHNLKNIDVKLPLNAFSVVTGVSGSGKTTLVKQIIYPAIRKHFGQNYKVALGQYDKIEGDFMAISGVEMIDQNPIGRSSRSNPVTYVKAYDSIRNLFAKQQLAKVRGYKPGHFSFNVDGGRCPVCKGEGEQLVEMQFLADIRLACEECKGKRFKKETLDIKYKGKNIHEILDLSIEEALVFFEEMKDVYQKIKPLVDVGLGYVKLGQSSSTLSGGEAQRVKLASFLTKEKSKEHYLFIFDEPTTGLHFDDIIKLLSAMNALVERGHTVLVVEHNMEVIKAADWVIDLGPEGGKDGGYLVFEGRPEELVRVKSSYTGTFLKEKLIS